MGNLYISAYGRSNVGKKRGNNEDNFYLSGITVDSATDITSSAPEVSELGFAVYHFNSTLVAGCRTSAASVTFFFVYFNNLSYHFISSC